MNNNNIQCVGFSQFIMAVVDALGVDYLQEGKCLMNTGRLSVAFKKDHYRELSFFVPDHAQSKHYLIDKKYDIEGEIIADALCGTCGSHYYLWKLANDITLIARIPLNTFSMIKDKNDDYKIYNDPKRGSTDQSMVFVGLLTDVVIVDGKTQRKILKETEKNEKIATGLEQKDISEEILKQAYERIIPLVFPEAQAGDIIAPIIRPKITKNGVGAVTSHDLAVVPNEGKDIVMGRLQKSIKEGPSLSH